MGADNTFGETHFNTIKKHTLGMSDNKWTPEPELYVNLWELYDRRLFFNSIEGAEKDKETAENTDGFIGTFKLVSPEYLETILKQRDELAEQVKELTEKLETAMAGIDFHLNGLP